jgi:D-aminopeptidase
MSGHWLETPGGRARARGLGITFDGTPGPFNAITDVPGVEVGYVTLIAGEGAAAIRTGVTAILPRGKDRAPAPCAAGSAVLNGNGEMTGLAWIEEAGELQTPVVISNTNAAGRGRDGILRWMVARGIGQDQDWGLPVAAETWDGDMNDINGFHVTEDHVMAALDAASGGAVEMGNVGGGTGMITYDFKGGSGSASRVVGIAGVDYALGVFVQSNFGNRRDFRIRGVPVGPQMTEPLLRGRDTGSIIAVVATDAPLQAHQAKRLARRVPLGIARTGTIGSNSSGDIFLAFSTARAEVLPGGRRRGEWLDNESLDGLFRAVVEATEEAIIDALICGETMTGLQGNTSHGLPHGRVMELMAGVR